MIALIGQCDSLLDIDHDDKLLLAGHERQRVVVCLCVHAFVFLALFREQYVLHLLRRWKQRAAGQRCRSWIPMGQGWYSGITPGPPVPVDCYTFLSLSLSVFLWVEINLGLELWAWFTC